MKTEESGSIHQKFDTRSVFSFTIQRRAQTGKEDLTHSSSHCAEEVYCEVEILGFSHGQYVGEKKKKLQCTEPPSTVPRISIETNELK